MPVESIHCQLEVDLGLDNVGHIVQFSLHMALFMFDLVELARWCFQFAKFKLMN